MSRLRSGGAEVVVNGVEVSRLGTEDARLGTLTAVERPAAVSVAGLRALEGPLVFQLVACTPLKVPGAVTASCNGGGAFEARGELSRGKVSPLLVVGDEARCNGVCQVQRGNAVIPSTAACSLRIERSGQGGAAGSAGGRAAAMAWPPMPSALARRLEHKGREAGDSLDRSLEGLERAIVSIEEGLVARLKSLQTEVAAFRTRWTAWVEHLPQWVDPGEIETLVRRVDGLLGRAEAALQICRDAVRRGAAWLRDLIGQARERGLGELEEWLDRAAVELQRSVTDEGAARTLLTKLAEAAPAAAREMRKQTRKILRDSTLSYPRREAALLEARQILERPFAEEPTRARELLAALPARREAVFSRLDGIVERGLDTLLPTEAVEGYEAESRKRIAVTDDRVRSLLARLHRLFLDASSP